MTMIVVSDIHGNLKTMDRVCLMQAKYPHALTVYLGTTSTAIRMAAAF